ncbi:unnamed protein product, partial [Rangifer tarandus platyrhynchus]
MGRALPGRRVFRPSAPGPEASLEPTLAGEDPSRSQSTQRSTLPTSTPPTPIPPCSCNTAWKTGRCVSGRTSPPELKEQKAARQQELQAPLRPSGVSPSH